MELRYFDPHLDLLHGKRKIVTIEKEVYYQSIELFVQCVCDLIIFKGVSIIKTNLSTLLWEAVLK